VAAGDADPVAEGRAGPVVGEDAERVGEMGFESPQRREVCVAAVGGRSWTGRRRTTGREL